MRNDFESNYLMHHGILGQKWGKKNGPPYPLEAGDHSASEKKAGWIKSLRDKHAANKRKKKQRAALEKARQVRAQKTAEKKAAEAKKAEFEKKKQEILRSGDAKQILEYKDQLTDQEIQSALNRLRNERDIKSMVPPEKSGFDKINSFMKKADNVYNWAQTGAKWYNITADLYNTFISDGPEYDWKKLPTGGNSQKKKKKKNNNDDDED